MITYRWVSYLRLARRLHQQGKLPVWIDPGTGLKNKSKVSSPIHEVTHPVCHPTRMPQPLTRRVLPGTFWE